MNKTKGIVFLFVIASIIVAGCVGSKQGNKQQTINTSGEDVKGPQGLGGSDWCKVGASITSGGQQGQFSFVIKGLTTYKGQEVCEAGAAFDQGGQSGSMTYYFSKDNKYAHIILKDASGKIINEMDTNSK